MIYMNSNVQQVAENGAIVQSQQPLEQPPGRLRMLPVCHDVSVTTKSAHSRQYEWLSVPASDEQ
jgi:hypothetical protein